MNILYVCKNDEVLENTLDHDIDDIEFELWKHNESVEAITRLGDDEGFTVEYITSYRRWNNRSHMAHSIAFDGLLVNACTYDMELVKGERIRQAIISQLIAGDGNGTYSDEDNISDDSRLLTIEQARGLLQ